MTDTENDETIRFHADMRNCPECGADLQGDPIPETHREHFGNAAHFNRLLARTDPETMRTVEFECPDCHARWPRG